MPAESSVPITPDGTCPLHPVIQLQRRQRRTGAWKVILNNCPLCASGLPASDGAPGAGDTIIGGRSSPVVVVPDDGDDERSVRSSASYRPSYRPRRASSSRTGSGGGGGRPDDSDSYSVRSSRSVRSESRSSRHARPSSRSRGAENKPSGGGSGGGGGGVRSSSRSRGTTGGGTASRHSDPRRADPRYNNASSSNNNNNNNNNPYDTEDESVCSRQSYRSSYSARSASRGRSRHEDDDDDARSAVSGSAGPAAEPPAPPPPPPPAPLGVRFHPETKAGNDESVASGGERSQGSSSGSGGSESEATELPERRGGNNNNAQVSEMIESALNAAIGSRSGSSDGSSSSGGEEEEVVAVAVDQNELLSSLMRRESEVFTDDDSRESYSSIEDGSRVSSFSHADTKQPTLPPSVLKPSRFGPKAPSNGRSEFSEDRDSQLDDSQVSSRRSSLFSEDSTQDSDVPLEDDDDDDDPQALVPYEEPEEEMEERPPPQYQVPPHQPPSRSANTGMINRPPPPPRPSSHHSSSSNPPPPSYHPQGHRRNSENSTPEFAQGKAYGGEPVETPIESDLVPRANSSPGDLSGGMRRSGSGVSLNRMNQQQQQQPPQQPRRPPSRSRGRDSEERSVNSSSFNQGNQSSSQQHRPPSRSRGRDGDAEGRSVANRPPPPNRARSRSRSRNEVAPRDLSVDPSKQPVGILRKKQQAAGREPPREPPSTEGRMREPPSGNSPNGNHRSPGAPSVMRNSGSDQDFQHGSSPHQANGRRSELPRMQQGQQPPGMVRGAPNSGRERSLPPEQRSRNAPPGPPPSYNNNNNSNNMRSPPPPQAPSSGPVYLPSQQQQQQQGGRDSRSRGEAPRGRDSQQYDHLWNANAPPQKQHHKPPQRDIHNDARKESYMSNTESETSPESEFTSFDQPSREEGSDPSTTPQPNDHPMAEPSAYDDKGRCTKHPHIRLRKKKMLGGWKVMLVNCPDCCIEEMLRMKRDRGNGGGGSKTGSRNSRGGPPRGKMQRRPSQDGSNSTPSNKEAPPIAQLTIRTHSHADSDVESTSSASEITYGTRTDYSKGSSNGRYEDNSGSGASGPHRVTRMPFTDAYGDKGWYTGEVASGSGLPHGQGTMHYCDGRMRGGWWSNGLAGGPPKNQRGPPPPHAHHPPPPGRIGGGSVGGGSVGSRNSHNQHQHHHGPPPPQYHQQQRNNMPPPPPQSSSTNGAVFNIEWTDLNGKDGYYTGETDESGEPHGMGSMRYVSDGSVLEGEWYHGEMVERRMPMNQHGSGGGGGDGRSVASNRSKNRRSGEQRGPVPAGH